MVFSLVLLLMFLGAFALIGGLIWLVVWTNRRRRAWLRERAVAAAAVGWYPAPPNPWLVQVAENLYRSGRAEEMYVGEHRGRSLCILDYTYTTSNGKTTQTHHVHLVALNLPAALPPLNLQLDSGLRRALGGRDLELENQTFNDKFRITCADDRYASAVLHPRMMEWLLHNPGLEWEIAGNALVSWGHESFTIPDTLARLDAMSGVVDLIPSFVLRDYGQPTFR